MTSPGTAANPCFVYCADRTGSVPPVSADLRTTATISTTGANNMTFAGSSSSTYYYGITFNFGSGAVSAVLNMNVALIRLENCALKKLGTSSTSGSYLFGSANTIGPCAVYLINTTIQFGNVGDTCSMKAGTFVWERTASAIQGATIPTTMFINSSSFAGIHLFNGVDLSAAGSGKTLIGGVLVPSKFIFKDCKLDAAVTVASTPAAVGGAQVYVVRSDSAGTNYRSEVHLYTGTLTTDIAVVRSSGASDGTTPVAWKIVTTANPEWMFPFEAPSIAIWNATTGSNVTATIEGVYNGAALPNNDEIWFDVEYLGASGSPLASFARGSKADGLASGSALTASTQAWDSAATARGDSTAYTLGQAIKLASNSGRIFFCTTAGTSAGSEPAGYASAVDGGSVTDGTAVFRAGMRFKQAVTMSSPQPQLAGTLYARVYAAKVSSTFYIDPLITLS
jgi:hypothetical protein